MNKLSNCINTWPQYFFSNTYFNKPYNSEENQSKCLPFTNPTGLTVLFVLLVKHWTVGFDASIEPPLPFTLASETISSSSFCQVAFFDSSSPNVTEVAGVIFSENMKSFQILYQYKESQSLNKYFYNGQLRGNAYEMYNETITKNKLSKTHLKIFLMLM